MLLVEKKKALKLKIELKTLALLKARRKFMQKQSRAFNR